jgi:molybdopterin molybdotransferase
LLAATGVEEIAVGRKPIIGLLATGSELRETGATLQPGELFESNRVMLSGLVQGAGGRPVRYPLVPDEPAPTERALRKAFDECDFVVTSGGVSVGEYDFVKTAFERIGGALQFWRVAMKPGKPFTFGKLGDKLLFGLPGNPVSAFVTFLLLARPALLKAQGAGRLELRGVQAELAEEAHNPGDRPHFMRVVLDQEGKIRAAGPQASHYLACLARADGLLEVPPGARWEAGRRVSALLID